MSQATKIEKLIFQGFGQNRVDFPKFFMIVSCEHNRSYVDPKYVLGELDLNKVNSLETKAKGLQKTVYYICFYIKTYKLVVLTVIALKYTSELLLIFF